MAQVLEVNEQNLQHLSMCLESTLSMDRQQRKNAEAFLESNESAANYGLLLLTLVDSEVYSAVVRTAAAIQFKNFVKRSWRIIEGEQSKISQQDRERIKSWIVDLMLKSQESLQRQLSDAISIIGKEDFPQKWQELLPKIISYLGTGDRKCIGGVLQTAHSLFKKFRYEFKSELLWKEIKMVLDALASPLTELFEHMFNSLEGVMNNPVELKEVMDILTSLCKIFYSLNYQDLPEFFEDNMARWMGPFHKLLITDFSILKTDGDEVGPIEKIRSQICDNVAMYAQKYDEEFKTFLSNFVTAIWNLLVTTGNQVKNDLLVSNAIQFLASVCERPQSKDLFQDQSTLQSICEKVIVPNMEFRDADEELFEDNPGEYIRRDIEGSDVDTRRRAACDFVRGLSKHFEAAVTSIFSQYVAAMLEMYNKNPSEGWKSKDAAIYLVTSLAAKKQTSKHGTTEANELVNLTDFFNTTIAPDLKSANVDEHPVLKADALKYIITFRSVLPRDLLLSVLPYIVNLLQAKSHVVHSYAACCLEKIFIMKSIGGGAAISSVELSSIKEKLLQSLFAVLNVAGSEENEYVMKAILRTTSTLQETILPYITFLIQHLSTKLTAVSKNPNKPQFNHYLFETICVLIRIVSKHDRKSVPAFEGALFPIVEDLLKNDVTEFLPYVFQVLSLLVEVRDDGIQGPYIALFPLLLQPVLWEKHGNIPALTKLLQAYIKRGAKQIVADGKLMPLLGVFQKLIASRANDHEGFYLLNTMVEFMDWPMLEPQFKDIVMLLFQRLHSSKTTKFVKGFLVFLCLFAGKHSPQILIDTIDGIQAKFFAMVVDKLFVTDLQKVAGHAEKKICAVGVTRVLTEAPSMLQGDYLSSWVPLLQSLIGLFELPEDSSIPDDEHYIDVEDTPGYQTAFSQLAFAGKKQTDPYPEVNDAKEYLAKQLYRLSVSCPGKIGQLIAQQLEPKAKEFLQGYLHQAQVSIA